MEACLAAIKESFERVLGRKVNLARTVETLSDIESLITDAMKTSELIRALEIRIGSDRQGLLTALERILNENKEYY